MKRMIIFASDRRQKYIFEYFEEKGFSCEYFDEKNDLRSADAVILPIPSEIDGKIKSVDLSCGEFVKRLGHDCVVFGFCMKNGNLEKELNSNGTAFFDVYENGELAVANAYATAQGVLKYILNETEKLLRETKILISGYGKTGRAICEILSSNKAKLAVLVRRAEYRSELREKGIDAFDYCEENVGEDYDYIINTVASKVVDAHILSALGKNGKILEIASKPYGIDFEAAELMNLKYEILPSLPSSAAPESSGRFMAHAIEKICEEGKIWKR